ncbi:MAG: hypothetical protein II060_08600, partial [Bacteroidales bacterium]|nr:hypothetical protein [Bacteroidales bacterium]
IIKVSADGGDTWTDHIVNADVQSNEYGKYFFYSKDAVDIFEAAGSQSVLIRFYMNSEGSGAAEGYGWEIDDIEIVEGPPCDLTLKEARISMFGYVDYRNVPDDFFPTITDPDERRETAYQFYDPYAQSPRLQWATESGYAAFNVEVSSYGYDTVTPMARIKITNPNGAEIYNKVSSGIRALSTNESDTVDFFNSDSFYFEGIESYHDIITGRYTVDFYVFADGMEDADESDNHTTQYFDITDNTFSMSYDEPTGMYNYYAYSNSASGDEYGIVFTYDYQPGRIGVDAYIDEQTTFGTAAQVIIYELDDNRTPVEVASSDTLIIASDMLGSWVNFPINDNFHFNSGDTSYTFMVTVRGIWNDGQTLALGSSDELTSFGHNCYMKLPNQSDTWYYAAPRLAIRVREKRETNDSTIFWSCDFEEGSTEPYITKTDESEEIWQIITEADYPDEMFTNTGVCYFLPMNYTGHEGNTDPNQQISETPEHWAFVDASSDLHESAPRINTSMTFTNINLSDCLNPKLSFLQSWRVLNPIYETISVETSTDEGLTWTTH